MTTTRRAVFFGSLAAAAAPMLARDRPAVAAAAAAVELKATKVSGSEAFITLMDGRDALLAAMELQGTEGGKRARVKNLLPKYASRATVMTAVLPMAMIAAYGEALEDADGVNGNGNGGGVPVAGINAMEDILVGANNLLVLAAYVSESRPFEDADIPQDTFIRAVKAIDLVLLDGPQEVLKKASGERCRRLISSAKDYDEMKMFASTPVCNSM